MRILAISDVTSWDGYEDLVTEHRPQVVVLAGDLTCDGGAAFLTDAFETIPAFREAKRKALRRMGITVEKDAETDIEVITGGTLRDVMGVEDRLKPLFRNTREFINARLELHTNRFYSFLKFAGLRSTVLVVKGDHDDDYPGDYQSSRISRIRGCQEISGKAVIVDGLRFLGLGYDQAGYRKPLREFVRQHQGAIDVAIAHPPHKNVPIVAEIRPRLLIRGHYAGGRYLVNGVPCVFTAGGHAIIELSGQGPPRIEVPSFSDSYFLGKYSWLAPY